MSKAIDDSLASFIVSTFTMIMKLIRSEGDRTKQEEALMEHAENVKAQLDRTKFVDNSVRSVPNPDSIEE